jgi:hypothetical protein
MRVPNTGLDREMRAIVREGYRLAERLLRDHRDPPGLFETIGNWLAHCRTTILGLYRSLARS